MVNTSMAKEADIAWERRVMGNGLEENDDMGAITNDSAFGNGMPVRIHMMV